MLGNELVELAFVNRFTQVHGHAILSRGVDVMMPDNRADSGKAWLTGLALMVTMVVCIYGFARLSPVWTLVISSTALLGLLAFFWRVGHAKRRGSGKG